MMMMCILCVSENVPYPGRLQEAEVLVVDRTQCQNQWTRYLSLTNSQFQVTNNMICAGGGCKDMGSVKHDDCSSLLHT